MVVAVAVSAFIVVFSLVASHALWTTMKHQSKVISEKEKARDQLIANIETVDELVVSYKAFTGSSENVIGGNPAGNGDKDGDNAKIVLDALPSKYDFPALTTSLEKIIKTNNNTIVSIGGTDDEVAQSSEQVIRQPIDVPFEMSASGSYQSIQELLVLLQRSVRPIQVQSMELSGTNSDLELSVAAKTFYQPERTLKIQTKVVR